MRHSEPDISACGVSRESINGTYHTMGDPLAALFASFNQAMQEAAAANPGNPGAGLQALLGGIPMMMGPGGMVHIGGAPPGAQSSDAHCEHCAGHAAPCGCNMGCPRPARQQTTNKMRCLTV